MKILLIDNNLAHSEYLSGVLTGKGHRVESVSKIEGLFPRILKECYELVFVEVKFPNEQSIKLLEDIKVKRNKVPLGGCPGAFQIE